MDRFAISFGLMLVSVFVLTVLAESVLIPILRRYKVGQIVLKEGPVWHQKKNGTPTMGGVGFILAILLASAVWFILRGIQGDAANYIPFSLTLAFAVANAAIGVLDDWCKLRKKENEGLTRTQKLFLQLAVSAAYICVLAYTGNFETALKIPFTDISWELGWFAYPLSAVILVGVINGSNFTDGLDGLESSVTCVIGLFIAFWGFSVLDEQSILSGAILIGATLGFLCFNHYPAKVFMGDTGSLFLGAFVIGTVCSSGELLAGLILCAVYIVEMLSSFLQILYYKATKDPKTGIGKKLFRMAPLHHHFEKCGWQEKGIVIAFSLAEIFFAVLTWLAVSA